MNERIKDILAQPVFERLSDWVNIGPVQRATLEEFAELIVKECIAKVSEWDMGIDDPVGAADNTSEVARDMVAEIKEHFGLK